MEQSARVNDNLLHQWLEVRSTPARVLVNVLPLVEVRGGSSGVNHG